MRNILTPELRITDIRIVTLNGAKVIAARVYYPHTNPGAFVFGGEFTIPAPAKSLQANLIAAAREFVANDD